MDKETRFPGYTALLPPRVRYDRELPAAAKLMFAEISAMTDVTGFCWATNGYLARLLGISKDRAARLIGLLETSGYVATEVIRDERNTVTERRIFVRDLGLSHLPPPVKNNGRGPGKNNGSPPGKNTGTIQNDKSLEHNPPIVPPRGTRSRYEHKDRPDWLPEDFEKLWLWYPTGDRAMHSKRGNRQKAIRAWDKLHPTPELVGVMAEALARQAASQEWREGVGIPHLSTWLNNAGWEGWESDER